MVSPEAAPAPLLERVHDARRVGATILAMDAGDPDLDDMAHEFLTVAPSWRRFPLTPPSTWSAPRQASQRSRGRACAARLARALDAISGPRDD